MNQKRSLDGFVQDAQKRAAEYDNKVQLKLDIY